MKNLIEGFLMYLFIAALIAAFALLLIEYSKQLEKEELQKTTYNECIGTNYDKFQCYSMIYGDK